MSKPLKILLLCARFAVAAILIVAAVGKLTSCPTCINATSMAGLEATAEAALDSSNGMVYCAQ